VHLQGEQGSPKSPERDPGFKRANTTGPGLEGEPATGLRHTPSGAAALVHKPATVGLYSTNSHSQTLQAQVPEMR
jgi:hypothetical protein